MISQSNWEHISMAESLGNPHETWVNGYISRSIYDSFWNIDLDDLIQHCDWRSPMFTEMLDRYLPNQIVPRSPDGPDGSLDINQDPYLMNLTTSIPYQSWKSRACCMPWIGEEISRGNRGLVKLLVLLSPFECRLRGLAPETQRILIKTQLFREKLSYYHDMVFRVPTLSQIAISIILRSLDVTDPENNILIILLGIEAIHLGVTVNLIRKLWNMIKNITAGDLETRIRCRKSFLPSDFLFFNLGYTILSLLEYPVADLILSDNLELWNMLPDLIGIDHKKLLHNVHTLDEKCGKMRGSRIMRQIVAKKEYPNDRYLAKYLESCGNYIPEILRGTRVSKSIYEFIKPPGFVIVADLHVTEELIESGEMLNHVSFWCNNYPDLCSHAIEDWYKDLCYDDSKTNAHLEYLNILFPDIYLRKYYLSCGIIIMVLIKYHNCDYEYANDTAVCMRVENFLLDGARIFHTCSRSELCDEDCQESVSDTKLRYYGSRMKSARK